MSVVRVRSAILFRHYSFITFLLFLIFLLLLLGFLRLRCRCALFHISHGVCVCAMSYHLNCIYWQNENLFFAKLNFRTKIFWRNHRRYFVYSGLSALRSSLLQPEVVYDGKFTLRVSLLTTSLLSSSMKFTCNSIQCNNLRKGRHRNNIALRWRRTVYDRFDFISSI